MPSVERALLYGRNYIETLVLTLTNYELLNPSLDVQEYITKRLEYELQAIALSYPYIAKIYKEYVLRRFRETYPEIPEPNITNMNVYNTILDHLHKHKKSVIKNPRGLRPGDLDKKLKQLAIDIVKPSILAVLYKARFLSLGSSR